MLDLERIFSDAGQNTLKLVREGGENPRQLHLDAQQIARDIELRHFVDIVVPQELNSLGTPAFLQLFLRDYAAR